MSNPLFYLLSTQRFIRSSVLLLPYLLDAHVQRFKPDESFLLTDIVSLIASSTKSSDFLRQADQRVFAADVVNVLNSAISGDKFTASNHQVITEYRLKILTYPHADMNTFQLRFNLSLSLPFPPLSSNRS